MRTMALAATLLLASGEVAAQQPAGTATGHCVTETGTRIELRHPRAGF